jgi:hypothetical protein
LLHSTNERSYHSAILIRVHSAKWLIEAWVQ